MRTKDLPGDASPTYYAPGSRQYGDATSPHNATATQRPAAVAVPTSADDVAAVVRDAGDRGWRVLPQATGHGATGDVGPDTLLVDTSAIDHVDIDPSRRIARVGAGATWTKVNAMAAKHGLVGLSGSAPDVGVSGYTFGGGVGWFVRAYGMASGALRTVRYVDGDGTLRTATDDDDGQVDDGRGDDGRGDGGRGDHGQVDDGRGDDGRGSDATDREALWAFRGAGGVGVAVELELDLFPVEDLWAGYALWPIEHLDAVTGAWATALPDSGPTLATSISVLHTPPAPPFPDRLRGRPVMHLAVASPAGPEEASALRAALAAVALPDVDTWGPTDTGALAGIHLDPPMAVPAWGDGRWLGPDAAAIAGDVLTAAAGADTPVTMVEVRNVATTATPRPGAITSPLAPFLLHAVGIAPTPEARHAVDAALAGLRHLAAPADIGRSAASFAEGRPGDDDALTPSQSDRLSRAWDAVDPRGTVHRSRFVAPAGGRQ